MSKSYTSLITVFIPVYNGSHYLPETIESLKRQTYTNFEVLLIDDHSTDQSLEVLKAQTLADTRFRIMQTPSNLGNAARVIKYGFEFVTGDYFVYSSQDDLFSADWLESMHARAIETGAEATIPDLVFYNPSAPSKERALIGLNGDKDIVLSGRDAFLNSLDWTIPGNALWKTNLLRKIGWFDFGMNADEYSVREFYLNCERVVFSQGVFFYRQNNPEAITKKMSVQTFDLPYTDLRLWRTAIKHDIDLETQAKLLNRSISTLMYFTTIAYKARFRPAIPKIKYTFEQLKSSNARAWLKENHNKDLRSKLNYIALQSYSLFLSISFLKAAIRRLKS